MTALIRHHLSPVLALALLATLLVASSRGQAAESSYDNVERIDVSSFTAAGIAVSKRVFPGGADAAVLTRDDHFPDALAASALAAKVNGPVLFTATGGLTKATAAELDRVLDAGDTVYITGGPAAVSENVENQVRARGYAVHRLDGPSRVETAVEIAEFVKAPSSGHVLLARAYGPDGEDRVTGWVDSVTCGAYANHAQTPVLLTQTANLDHATATALDALNAKKVTICGGEMAVSGTVARQLRDAGLTVERVAGATRIETAVDAAKKLFGATSAAGRNYLLVTGYGENFGWGLAATPLAGALEAPILLVAPDQPTSCTDKSQSARATLCYLETVGSGKAELVVIGSTAQVGDSVRDAAAKAAGGQTGATTGGDTGGDTGTDGDTGSGALAVPTSVKTSNVSTPSEGRVAVSWAAVSDPDSRLKGYNVYYGTSSPTIKAGSSTPTVGPNATSFTVGALQLDTTYTFAVTSVTTDGKESAKSGAVSEKTTGPSVDLTSPSAASPASVQPSSALTVKFDYAASEGGSFQLFHRPAGGDTWTAFPETPNATPGAVAASHGTTRSVNVTTPGGEGTYDLRVVLRPTGTDAVSDIETGALKVAKPKVTLKQPTAANKTEVLPGAEGVEVVFDYATNADGAYTVSLRGPDPAADDPWTLTVAEGEAPAGSSTGTTVTFVAPTNEGFYDVRVQIQTDAGDTHTAIGAGALYVVTPTIDLTAPTTPVLAGPGANLGAQSTPVQFDTNAGGQYEVQHRPAGGEAGWADASSWTTFEGADATGGTAAGGAAPVRSELVAPDTVGSYDLSVALTPNADPATPVRTGETAGTALLHVASVAMTAPTAEAGNRQTVAPGGDLSLEFDLNTPVDVTYQLLARPTGTTQAWTALHEPQSATATDGQQHVGPEAVPAPSDAGRYDLRLLVEPATGDGSIEDVEIDALEVEEATSLVSFDDPAAGDPVQVANDEGGATFSVTFTPEVAGTYTITCDGAATECDSPLKQGRVEETEAGQEKEVTGLVAPARDTTTHANNTYDLTVTLDPDDASLDPGSDTVTGGLRVGSADITSYPADDGNGEVQSNFTVTFVSNVQGTYTLSYRSDDAAANDPWTDAGGDGSVSRDSSESVTVTKPAEGTYDLKVEVTFPDDATGSSATILDEVDQAFTVPSGGGSTPTATVDQAPTATPSEVEPLGNVTIKFTASYANASSASYTLSWRSRTGTAADWQQFEGNAPTGTPNNGSSTSASVEAPPLPDDYDLRVEIFLNGNTTEPPAAVGETERGLTVAPETGGGVQEQPVNVAFTGPDDPAPSCIERTGATEGFTVDVDNNGPGPLAGAWVRFDVTGASDLKIEYQDGADWKLAYQGTGPQADGGIPLPTIQPASSAPTLKLRLSPPPNLPANIGPDWTVQTRVDASGATVSNEDADVVYAPTSFITGVAQTCQVQAL